MKKVVIIGGGIAGVLGASGMIDNCYSAVNIELTGVSMEDIEVCAGGLAGYMSNYATISNCYYQGELIYVKLRYNK